MPRKGAASQKSAKGGSEIAKMLSSTKSLQSRVANIIKLKEMDSEERPKLDEDGAAELHNLLESVAEKGMNDEMRATMNVIYDYAIDADEAETSTQSARLVTEGRFFEVISRCFSVVSPRLLKEQNRAAKRPLSALLKLVTYVADDDTNANAMIGSQLLDPVFKQWICAPDEDSNSPRDADIQFLVLELLAVLFGQMHNVEAFLTPTKQAHEKICAILDFAVNEGERSAEICVFTVKVLAELARRLQLEKSSQPSNPVLDWMERWLKSTATGAAESASKRDGLVEQFRGIVALGEGELSEGDMRRTVVNFCSCLLPAAGRKAFRFVPCNKIYFGESTFFLQDGVYASDYCFSTLLKSSDDEQDSQEEEAECADEVLHIDIKNINGSSGDGTTVCLQLLAPIPPYHDEDEAQATAELQFFDAGDKKTFLTLLSGGPAAVCEVEEDLIKSQDSRMRCDIAIMDHEGRIVTPMPRNHRDSAEEEYMPPKVPDLQKPVERGDSVQEATEPTVPKDDEPREKKRRATGKRAEKSLGSSPEQHEGSERDSKSERAVGGEDKSAASANHEPSIEATAADVGKRQPEKRPAAAAKEAVDKSAARKSVPVQEQPEEQNEARGLGMNEKPSSPQNQRPRRGTRPQVKAQRALSDQEEPGDDNEGESWEPTVPKARVPKSTKKLEVPPSKYDGLKMDELKGLLEMRSLARTGNKSDLIRRLDEDDSRVNVATAVLSQKVKDKPRALSESRIATSQAPSLGEKIAKECKKAQDTKSMDASVFDFSDDDEDAGRRKPASKQTKAGHGRQKALTKKTAPARKPALDVKASSGPAFSAAEALSSKDSYVHEWMNNTAFDSKLGGQATTSTDDVDAMAVEKADEPSPTNAGLENARKKAADECEAVTKNVSDDSDKSTQARDKTKPPSEADHLPSKRAGVRGTRKAKRTLFTPPSNEAAVAADGDKSGETAQHPNAETAATEAASALQISAEKSASAVATTSISSTEEAALVTMPAPGREEEREVEAQAIVQSTDQAGADLIPMAQEEAEQEAVLEPKPTQHPVKSSVQSQSVGSINASELCEVPKEEVRPSKCQLTTPPRRSGRRAQAARGDCSKAEAQKVASSSASGNTNSNIDCAEISSKKAQKGGLCPEQTSKPDVETEKQSADSKVADVKGSMAGEESTRAATATLDDSTLSTMMTSQKGDSENLTKSDSDAKEGTESQLGPEASNILEDRSFSQNSAFDDFDSEDCSPAPMSNTPKKKLFLSDKPAAKSSQHALGEWLGDGFKISQSIEPTQNKKICKNAITDEESDFEIPDVADVGAIGVDRKFGSFSSRVGQQLERLLADIGKKKKRALEASFELKTNKLKDEAKVLSTQTTEAITKFTERCKRQKTKAEEERQQADNIRVEKYREYKQGLGKLYQSCNELRGNLEGNRKRQQKRRNDVEHQAKDKAKKLRQSCAAELKKLETTLSADKANKAADMKQLQNLLGQLFKS